MKIFFSLIFLFCFCIINAQQVYFNKRYDYNNNNEGIFTVLPTDSGYLTAAGFGGILIQFIDINGELKWQKTYSDSNHNYYVGLSNSFIPTLDGGYAIGGGVQDTTGDGDGLLVKFDQNLDTLWTKKFTWQYFNTFYQCKQTPDGSFILIGIKDVSGSGNNKTWLVKTDSLGNLKWQKTFNGYGSTTIVITKEGNYLFRDGNNLTKTDTAANVIWSKLIDNFTYLTEAANGDYLGGYGRYDTTLSGSFPQYTPALIRLDTSGTVIWQKTYGPSRYGAGFSSLIETSEGDIVAAGQSNHNNTGGGNGYPMGIILKVNSQGDSLWYREYNYNICDYNSAYLRDIKPITDGSIIAAGFIFPNSIECPGDSGQQDMWVIKMDSCGCMYAGCDSVCAGLVGETELRIKDLGFRIYPNPANEHFYIESIFSFPVIVQLYDIFGREILNKTIYKNNEKLETSFLSGGIYACCITDSSGQMRSGKLVVER